MELQEVMRTTGAARELTDEPVAPEVLHAVLDAARFAPSGGNRQGWHVVVVQAPEVREQLSELYRLAWREYAAHVAEGLVPFAPGADGRWTEPAVDLDAARAADHPTPFAEQIRTAPVVLVVVADLQQLAVVDNGLDRQSIVGGASIYPFCQNVLLAGRDQGLAGVMTTVLCRQEPAVADLLGIPAAHALAALIVLGHPPRHVRKLRRKAVEEIATVDRFDGPPLGPGGR